MPNDPTESPTARPASAEMISFELFKDLERFYTIRIEPGEPTNLIRGTLRSDAPDPAEPREAPAHFLTTLRAVDDDRLTVDPAIQAILPRDQALAVCDEYVIDEATTFVARELARGRVSYAQAIKDGFLQRMWQYTRNFDIEKDSFPLNFGAPIPIAELHRPQVDGAKSWIEQKSTGERSLELDLKIGALGGGFGLKQTISVESGVETAGDCQLVTAEVSGSATIWRHLETSERIFLLSVTGVSSSWSSVPIPADDPSHQCAHSSDLRPLMAQLTYANAVVDRDYRYIRPAPSQATAPKLKSLVHMGEEREYKGSWRIGLSDTLPDIGGVSISSKFTHEVTWALEHTAGPELLATYRSPGEWPLLWSHP